MNLPTSDRFHRILEEFLDLKLSLAAAPFGDAIEPLRNAFNQMMSAKRFDDVLVLNEGILLAIKDMPEETELIIWCLLGIGNAQFHLNNDNEAELSYHEMLNRAVATTDEFLRATALSRLGDLARKRSQSDLAEQYYKQSAQARIDAQDFFGLIEVYLSIAVTCEEADLLDKANKALSTASITLNLIKKSITKLRQFEQVSALRYWALAIRFQQASLERRSGDLKKSERTLRLALRTARRWHDRRGESKLLQNIAGTLVEQGRLHNALPVYIRGLNIAVAEGLFDTSQEIQLGLATTLFKMRRFQDSLFYYNLVREALMGTHDQGLLATVTADAGAVCIEAGEFSSGIALLTQGLEAFRRDNRLDWQDRTLRNLMVAYAHNRDGLSLRKTLHECLDLIPQGGFVQRQSAYRLVGSLYLDIVGDYAAAAMHFRQAVEEMVSGGNLPDAGRIAALSAASLKDEGAYTQAILLFDRADTIFADIGDVTNLWRVRNDRAIALYHLGEFDEALEQNFWCLDTAIEICDEVLEAQAQLNLSELTRRMGDVYAAQSHANRALDMFRGMEDQEGQLESLNSLGLCIWDQKRLSGENRGEEAYPVFAEALRLAQNLRLQSEEAMATRGLAHIAEERDQIDDALKLYKRAASLWERHDDFRHCAEALASYVSLSAMVDKRRWRRGVLRLMEVANRAGALGIAARGIVGGVHHLINSGDLNSAADMAFQALFVNWLQGKATSLAPDVIAAVRESQDDHYDIIAYILNLINRKMTQDQQAAFLDRILIPSVRFNMHEYVELDVLRKNFELVRKDLEDSENSPS